MLTIPTTSFKPQNSLWTLDMAKVFVSAIYSSIVNGTEKKDGKNRNDLLKVIHYGIMALHNHDTMEK